MKTGGPVRKQQLMFLSTIIIDCKEPRYVYG